ncbi:MAG: ribbon-helix-helix domain-containing protein [Vicinamibacterales bacterium]
MSILIKKPLQVYLRQDQMDALRSLALRRKVPLSELVRQGVDEVLAGVPVEDDPLLKLIGLINSGPEDLSENHDEYLAERYAAENQG